MNVPRTLPESMLGIVVQVKVGGTTVFSQYIPWAPFFSRDARNNLIGGNIGRILYIITAATDSTKRTIKFLMQREFVGTKDAVFIVGNADPILANTTIEVRRWV